MLAQAVGELVKQNDIGETNQELGGNMIVTSKSRTISFVAGLIGSIALGLVCVPLVSGRYLTWPGAAFGKTDSVFRGRLSIQSHFRHGRIAFVSNRGGNSDIYVMYPDGTGLVNITNHPASDRLPAWSPDGTKIAFRSTRDGNSEIYVMNDDGSNVVRLTFDPAVDTSPGWTLDGRVLFSSNRSGRFEIYSIEADGTDLLRIPIAVDGQLTFPASSPEGHRLVITATNFSDAGALWITSSDGSHAEQLTHPKLVAAFPAWSPVGNRIVFANNVCPVCDLSKIFVVNEGGNHVRQLTTGEDNNDLYPRWSPDGSQIVFSRDAGVAPTEIYLMNSDGSGVMNITQNPAFDFEADWGR